MRWWKINEVIGNLKYNQTIGFLATNSFYLTNLLPDPVHHQAVHWHVQTQAGHQLLKVPDSDYIWQHSGSVWQRLVVAPMDTQGGWQLEPPAGRGHCPWIQAKDREARWLPCEPPHCPPWPPSSCQSAIPMAWLAKWSDHCLEKYLTWSEQARLDLINTLATVN